MGDNENEENGQDKLRIVESANEIKKLQKIFYGILLKYKHKMINAPVGYRGGGFEDKLYWFEDLGFWFSHDVFENNRYWNGFGIQNPNLGHRLSITCEINIPFSGINRRVAGAFLKDGNNVYVIHRGNIGGSREGVGKTLFLRHYTGDWIEVLDGNRLTKVALIGSLYSNKFQYQLKQFVFEIDRIKKIARASEFNIGEAELVDEEFSNEFFGTKKYTLASNIREAQCNHGLIVSSLSKELKNRDYKVANDVYRDLYIMDNDKKITMIFEVKTDITRTNIYCAIGQLFLNNFSPNNNPEYILVLPEKPSPRAKEKLNIMGIKVVTYKWIPNRYVFDLSACSFCDLDNGKRRK